MVDLMGSHYVRFLILPGTLLGILAAETATGQIMDTLSVVVMVVTAISAVVIFVARSNYVTAKEYREKHQELCVQLAVVQKALEDITANCIAHQDSRRMYDDYRRNQALLDRQAAIELERKERHERGE